MCLFLREGQLISIRVFELKKLYAGAWTVQVILDITRFDSLFIEFLMRGCNVGS